MISKTKKGRELFDFNYNFNVNGYLPFNIPVVADYGREHEGQLSKEWSKQGLYAQAMREYVEEIKDYKEKILSGKKIHIFRDGSGKLIKDKFSSKQIRKYYAYVWKSNIILNLIIHRGPSKVKQVVKKLLK